MPRNPEALRATASAKVNLFLHVTGKRDDGYHLLDSLVVFAKDVCDILTFRAADAFTVDLEGTFINPDDSGLSHDNLVLRAARTMTFTAKDRQPYAITLEKNIPVGAGLGGGSADAAATVRALEHLWDIPVEAGARTRRLAALGADVPVCYESRTCRFHGIGDDIAPVSGLPPFHLLLIWPDTHVSTKDVFASPRLNTGKPAPVFPDFKTLQDFTAFLKHQTRNDMMDAACGKTPVIGDALAIAGRLDGCLLARMSGSGASVYGLFETHEQACAAARHVKAERPHWWAQASAVL